MGFNHSSISHTSLSKTDLLGAVLAGFGIWTTPSPAVNPQQQRQPTASNISPLRPALRVTRIKEGSP